MRRSRRSPPPPRTPQEREEAFREREARRAARHTGAALARRPAPSADAPVGPSTAAATTEAPLGAAEAATEPVAPRQERATRARNTAIFSVLTGLSRIAGLAREIVAAAYYGTAGAASAFTLAFIGDRLGLYRALGAQDPLLL